MAQDGTETYAELRERFVSAREKASRADHHRAQIPKLETELEAEQTRYEELRAALAAEQRDVDKLEKFSFKKLRAKVGSEGFDAALEREKLEAQAAADAVSESSEHMAGLRNEIGRLTTELEELKGANEAAEAVRFELETHVRRNFPAVGEELGLLDQRIVELTAAGVEIEEAIAAGDFAAIEMTELVDSLKDTKKWSNLDVAGGGMLVSMQKRDKIKVSSEKSRSAALSLEILNKEVQDTALSGMSVQLEDALGQEMLDVWFDNMFTDAKVHNQIHAAQQQAIDVQGIVAKTLTELHVLAQTVTDDLAAIEHERRDILARPQSSA